MLIVPALSGFQSLDGLLYMKVDLKQFPKGPAELPSTQVLCSPHHPQEPFCTQVPGLVESTLQLTCIALKLDEPS